MDGLNLPFHRANKQNGQDSSEVQYTSIQTNPAVDAKIFEKPAAPAVACHAAQATRTAAPAK